MGGAGWLPESLVSPSFSRPGQTIGSSTSSGRLASPASRKARWALETATRCTVTVAGTDAREDLPVATAAALVAMKLHAIQDRSSDEKRASDAWDLYRLLNSYNRDGTLSNAFADGPPGLTALVAGALTRVFRTEVTRTRHWIVGYGEPGWSQVLSTQVLADITDEFVTGLELRSPLGE